VLSSATYRRTIPLRANASMTFGSPARPRAASLRPSSLLLMAIIKELREFIAKGNVIDLAVGVIIGAAFGNIVKSLTEDVVMPSIGKMLGGLGGLNFKDYFIPLDGQFTAYKTLEQAKASTALFAYGSSLRS
jgi:large-conductance mechanosensitive channel